MTGRGGDHKRALPAGSRVGAYTILGVLGFGASGITYRARDKDGATLALKEFFPLGLVTRDEDDRVTAIAELFANDVAKHREVFIQQAERLTRLDAAHVVRVLAVLEANDTAYYAMSLVDGAPLSERILRADLSPANVRRLADHMLTALDGVHRAGLLHCDIKPQNIIVDDESGTSTLIDFGAAKDIADDLTQAQTKIGTEHYRAPEQMSEQSEAGPDSDIYGLAATLYHALTGRVPEDAATRQVALLNGAPDPLADISVDIGLQEAHGEPLLEAVMAGLALRRAHRPQSIDAWRALFSGTEVYRPALSAAPRSGVRAARRPSPAAPERPSPPPPASNQPPARSRPGDGFAIEPEQRPWGRWVAGGVLVALIAISGIWLIAMTASTPSQGGDDAPSMAEDSADAPAAPRRSADNEAWVRALEQDTLEGYRAYLEAFPEGRFKAEAQAEIDRYDTDAWADAQQRNTLAGYDAYLEAWPEGLFASQARERANAMRAARDAASADAAERAAAEVEDWARAAGEDTVAAYDAYLEKHPAGANAAEARARRDRLQAQAADRAAFQQAQALNTVRAYEQYLNQFPRGAFQMQAVAAIDALKPAAGRTFRDCPQCPLMVTLAPGSAELGAPEGDPDASPAEGPQRPVTFSGFFAIAETEITFDQWQACVAGGGCAPVAGDNGWGRGSRPVINVTWNDAAGYAAWLSETTGERYGLPSEAQWEYAARGGQTSIFPGGSPASICAVANGAARESGLAWANQACADPAPDRTLPAGALIANGFGLKDMVGNVAEWTMDCGTLNLRDAPSDGTPDLRGSCNQRAVRGGSWFSGPKDLRFTSRLMLRRGDSNDFTGFRVVREIND